MPQTAIKDAEAVLAQVRELCHQQPGGGYPAKTGAGQTLTALGSYWKGRKPLILVRAILLGSLLPRTDDPEKDLEISSSN